MIWQDVLEEVLCHPDVVFSVVRDPVQRMVSEYHYQQAERNGTWRGKCLASLSFSSWLRVMLHLYKRNPYAYDNHFRPQVSFMPEEVIIFRLEEGLAPVGHWLEHTTGQSLRISSFPRVLQSQSHRTCQIHAQDIALITALYAADYSRFGYPVPEAQDYPLDRFAALRDTLARTLTPFLYKQERCGKL